MTFTQGLSPGEATQYVDFKQFHKLYKMLRCRFAFIPTEGRVGIIDENNVLPRLHIIQRFEVIQNRDDIFKRMEEETFDPWEQIILEKEPIIMPVVSQHKGNAAVVDESTDHLTIQADLPNPAILLITDIHSPGWRIQALPGSTQQRYEMFSANYILRAIPLAQGHHHIRVEYLPLSFQIGKWISVIAGTLLMVVLGFHVYKRRRGPSGTPPVPMVI
jgi:hypothetical protein